MSLESVLANVAASIAKKLIDRAIEGKPLVGTPLDKLMAKAQWTKVERTALREAARKRVGLA